MGLPFVERRAFSASGALVIAKMGHLAPDHWSVDPRSIDPARNLDAAHDQRSVIRIQPGPVPEHDTVPRGIHSGIGSSQLQPTYIRASC